MRTALDRDDQAGGEAGDHDARPDPFGERAQREQRQQRDPQIERPSFDRRFTPQLANRPLALQPARDHQHRDRPGGDRERPEAGSNRP